MEPGSLAAVSGIALRVMTANLWTWHCDPRGFLRVIRDVDPDVLAVQELHPDTAGAIVEHFAYHALDPHHDTLGTAIAAKRPFELARLATTHRGGWIARLNPPDWPGLAVPVDFINMHFANPLGWPWWRSYRLRRRELDTLCRHVATTTTATVVVGDFNASPAWPLYRALAATIPDAAVGAATPRRTWRFKGVTPPLLRIDHVFVAGGRASRTWTVQVPGADHLALVAELEFG